MIMIRIRPSLLAGALSVAWLGFASVSHADMVTISIATDVAASPGNTLTVFGDLTNNTTSTLYFGNDAVNLTAPSTVGTAEDDLILNGLLGSGPVSVAAGTTLTNVDLFSVNLLSGSGVYTGNNFQLFGGTDAVECANGTAGCTAQLGSATFSLTVAPVPLPAAAWFMLSGLGGLAAVARKKITVERGAPINPMIYKAFTA